MTRFPLKLTLLLTGLSLEIIHAQTFSESAVFGKWQGSRYQLNFHADHTFDQDGWTDQQCRWRIDGDRLTYNYPDLGDDIPPWYPGAGKFVEQIVLVSAEKLITKNEKGYIVRYHVKGDSPGERDSAATRAKAEQVGLSRNTSNPTSKNQIGVGDQRTIADEGSEVHSLATPGSDRFVIAGLRVGDGPAALEKFISSNNLRPTSPRKIQNFSAPPDWRVRVDGWTQTFGNGKSGAEEVTVRLQGSPEFETKEGLVSVIYEIDYTTNFGEGASIAELVADLKKKYGETESIGSPAVSMRWDLNGCDFTASVLPSEDPGLPGKLRLYIFDHNAQSGSFKLAAAYLKKIDSKRPKDKTKPSY